MDEHKTVLEFRENWSELEKDPRSLGNFLKERGALPQGMNLSLAIAASEKISGNKGARTIVDKWLMDDEEYLGIVAIFTMGKLMIINPGSREAVSLVLKHAVINKKWRIRESVPLALKPLVTADPKYAIDLFERWTAEGYPIMFRTALEGIGDIKLLKKNTELAEFFRKLHLKAMADLSFHPKETGKPVELLRKTLSSSITTLAMLDEGTFTLMEEWGKDPSLRPILRKNLGNTHFRQRYPEETASLLEYLETGRKK